jgi:hypothetical protein
VRFFTFPKKVTTSTTATTTSTIQQRWINRIAFSKNIYRGGGGDSGVGSGSRGGNEKECLFHMVNI